MENLCVCIMAGGSGERFWPLSRTALPKHLLRLFSDKTLLEQTVQRVSLAVPKERIFILTNKAQMEATRRAVPHFPAAQIIAEPVKRDTAPACALGTAMIQHLYPDSVVALIASDHLINDGPTFAKNLKDAAELAAKEHAIVTFGIKPSWPSPDLGYLELGSEVKTKTRGGTKFFAVKRFVEKPDAKTAAKYLKTRKFAWNSGMFVWKTSHFIKEMKKHQPAFADFIENFPKGEFSDYIENEFLRLPKISIDYALMEKTEKVIAVRADFDWDDIGYWRSVEKHLKKDKAKNAVHGATAIHDSSGNIVYAPKRFVALVGVKDLIVVETDDAILVCHREMASSLKKLSILLPEDLR